MDISIPEIWIVRPSDIIETMKERFLETCSDDSKAMFESCILATQDYVLLNNIIFCNDAQKIPPLVSFTKTIRFSALTEVDLRYISDFWGFVFQKVFGYKKSYGVPADIELIDTATVYEEPAEAFILVRDREETLRTHFLTRILYKAEPVGTEDEWDIEAALMVDATRPSDSIERICKIADSVWHSMISGHLPYEICLEIGEYLYNSRKEDRKEAGLNSK